MKRTLLAGAAGLSILGAAHGEGLYYVGSEAQESMPLKWVVGANLTYDDNVNPTYVNSATGRQEKDSATSINPYVGLSFVSITPQTTWDVYARLGLIYYFDKPSGSGVDDVNGQARIGINLTHNFNERLRFSSRNFLAYELEPDYSRGFASSRQSGEYLYWETDNALGYRWTERLATYTGISLTGLDYDSSVPNADRFTWTAYHQFRYQLNPQSVLTAEYRYAQTSADGLAQDSTDQYILAGIEHRLSPNTILVARAGVQIHDADGARGDSSNPYAELALNSQINTAFRVRAFARYGVENYDTVRSVFNYSDSYTFSDRRTFRLGVSGDYAVSQKLSIFGGLDYIPSRFDDGDLNYSLVVPAPPSKVSGLDEDLISAYIGVSLKFTDTITGDLTYTYTDSSSDLIGNSYSRNRVSVGVRAEF